MSKDEVPEAAWDLIINLIATKMLRVDGLYREVMDGLEPEHRQEVDAALERHAARQRAKGLSGW